jgi:hypothetical protein
VPMNLLTRPLLLASLLSVTISAAANDFPTADRVLYVQECIKAHPGANFEMVSKCSCALDKLAVKVKFEDYVTMSTIVKAVTIGGERGADLRDNESVKPQIKRYRDLQADVQKSCFLSPQ